ncbi:hypothetical protein [Actinomadura harenae]|uniref:Uncharacterized protein n=1 Tax=Actinomadura harenae TaxID=2483351 RepID=A0A3M2LTR9_9ACTN|nr:hypothetical protein [Actinomadura harenae]RMI40797.1 hypothetical protein EBO15_25085 [Actinomadura harenae]
MAQRKLPDLSATQLIASGAATMVAAYGASYLGVYGTILGAAFMSVVSTAASVVGKHYLDQGKEQIKERAHLTGTDEDGRDPVEAARTATSTDATRAAGSPLTADAPVAGPGRPAGRAPAPGRLGGGDPNTTRVDDPSGRPVPGGDPNATRFDLPTLGDPNATRFDASGLDGLHVDRKPARTVVEEAVAGQSGGDVAHKASWQSAVDDTIVWARQRWKMLTASAVVVFVVVIGGITLYESVTDQTFGGVKGNGGTIGNVIRGQNEGAGDTRTHEPSRNPSDEPSTTGTPTPDGGSGAPDQPTTRPTDGPTEKPTESPSVSPTPTGEPTTTPTHEPSSGPSGGGAGQGGGGQNGGTTGKPGLQAPASGEN